MNIMFLFKKKRDQETCRYKDLAKLKICGKTMPFGRGVGGGFKQSPVRISVTGIMRSELSAAVYSH